MTTANFLTSLVNPVQRVVDPEDRDRTPYFASDFANVWNCSTERAQLLADIKDFQERYPPIQQSTNRLRLVQL